MAFWCRIRLSLAMMAFPSGCLVVWTSGADRGLHYGDLILLMTGASQGAIEQGSLFESSLGPSYLAYEVHVGAVGVNEMLASYAARACSLQCRKQLQQATAEHKCIFCSRLAIRISQVVRVAARIHVGRSRVLRCSGGWQCAPCSSSVHHMVSTASKDESDIDEAVQTRPTPQLAIVSRDRGGGVNKCNAKSLVPGKL
ncbi:hypothetical protein F4819DRAFT_98959 [Hypoxylon fuscum]|nr:hypothetical protein F4819DRAFT_98959 [Hypoxylon fuscum]